MPALPLDVSLLHLNRADERGNAQFLGPDLYMDDLFASAAEATFVSCEKVVPTAELTPFHTLRISRLQVDGVVEAPGGAGFTSCQPDYERDEDAQRAYAVTSRDPDAWTTWLEEWRDS
jgi:glutaconate CoA-transferase subunit A